MRKYLLLICLAVFSISCSDDSSSSPSTFSGKGVDYLPLKSNEIQTYQLNGQGNEYDLLGALVASDNANREEKVFLGQVQNYGGGNYIPIYAYDSKTGEMDNYPNGYLSNNGTSVAGKEDSYSSKLALILPETFGVGTEWVVNPFDPVKDHQKAKCEEHLSSYKNKLGNTYNDVIKVSIKFYDSTFTAYDQYYEYTKSKKADVIAYLAKDKGIIEAVGEGYEFYKEKYYSSYYGNRNTGSYTISRKEK